MMIPKNPSISCHQYCITEYLRITVKTTANKIKVAISLNCLSLIFGMESVFPLRFFNSLTLFQHQK